MVPISVARQLPGCLWHTACHPFRLLTNCLDVYGTLHVTRFGCLPIAWMFMAYCMSPVSVAYQLPGCLWHTACHPFRLLTNCLDVYGTLHVTRFGCLPIAWMFMAHCMSPVSVAYQLPGCLWHTACHPFRFLTNCLDVYGILHVTRFGCLPIAWMFMAHCMSPVSVAYQLPGCLWHTACHPFRLLTNCLDVYGILHVTRFGCLPIAWIFMAHCMSPVSVACQLPGCLWHTACHPFRLLTNCLDVYGTLHVTRFGCLPIAWMFMAHCMSPVSVAYQLPGCLWHTACHPFRLLTNCLDVYGTLHVTRFGCLPIAWMFMAHCMSPVSVAYQLPGCLWHTACHPFRLLTNCLDVYGTLHVTRFGCLPIAWMFMAHCMSPVSVAYQLPGCLWHTACHPFRLLTNCLDVYGTLHVTRFGCLPIAWMFMAHCMSPVSVAYQLPGCLWHTACHPFRLLTNCLDVYGILHVTRFGCLPIAWMFMAYCMSPVSVAYQLPGCLWHTACHPFRLLTNCLDVYGTLHVTRFGCLPIAWMFMAHCMSPVSVAYQLPGCLWHTACHPFRLLTNCLDVYGTLHVTRFGCLPIAWMFMAHCMSPVSVAYQLPGCLWHTACHPFRLLTNCLDVYGILHVTRFGCLPIAWMFMAYCMSPVSVAYQLPGCLWHTACHPFRLLTNCLDVYGTLHVTRFGCLPIAWMFMAHCMSSVSVAYQLPGCLWHTACHPFRLLTNCLDVYGTLHVTRFGCLPIAWMFMAHCMSPVSVAYQFPGCLWHTACHPFRLLTNCLDVYGILHVTRFGCLPIAWIFMAHCMSPVSVACQLPGCLWHTACHPFRLLTNCLDVYGTLHVTRFGCLPIAWMFMAHCMSPVSVAYQLPGCLWHTACHPFLLLTNCLDVYGTLHVTRFGCLPIAWMFMAHCMSPVSVAYQLPGCLWHTACHPFRLLTNCLDVYGTLHVTRFGCLPIAWMFMAHCMSPVSVAYQFPGCLWHTACHPFRLLTNCLDVYGTLHVTRFGCLPIAWMFMAHCMSPVSVAYQLPGCLWHTACHPFRLLTNCLDVYGTLHVTRFGCLPIAWMFMAHCMSPVSVAYQLPGCLWHTACHPFRLLTNCLDVYGTLHVTRFGCLPIAWMFMTHCMSPVSVAYQLPGCLWHTACHPFRLLTNCLDVYGTLHVTRFGCLPIAWMFMAHCMSPVSVAYQLPGCLWHTACHPFRLLTNCLDVYGILHVTRFGCLPIAWMFMAYCMSPVSVAYQLPGCLWHTACHPFRLLTNCLDVYGTLHVTRFGCLPIAWMFMAHCMSPVSVAYQLPGCLWHTACHPFRLLTNCLDVYGTLHVTRFGCLPIAWMFMAHCMSPVSVAYQLPGCLWHTACHPFRLLTNCLDVYGILHVTRFGCLPIAWMFMAYCMSPVSVAYQLPGCLWHTACHPFRLLTNCLDVYGTLHVTRFGCLPIAWMFMAHCMSPVSVAYQLPGCLWHTACHPFRLLTNCLDVYGTLHVTRFGCLPIAWMFMAHCMSPVSVAYQFPGCLWHTACHPFLLLTNCLDVYGILHVTRFGCLPIAWIFMAHCMSPVSVACQLPGCLWHTACHPFRLLTNCLDVYGTLHVTRFGCLPIAWMFMAHCMSPVSVAYQLPGCLWHTACHPFRLLANCLDVYGTLHVTRFGCLPIAWMFMAHCMSPVSVAYQLPGCLWHTACHPFRLLTNCLDVYGTLHVTRFGCLPIAWMFMAYCMSPVSVAYQLPGCLWHTACHPFRLLTNCLDVYGTLHVTRFGCLPIAWMFMAHCMSPVSVAYQLPGCLWHTACHPFRLLTNCLDVYGTLHVTRFGCLPIAWMFMAHCMSPVSVAYQLPGCLWHTACHPFRLLTNCLDVYGILHVTRFCCLPIAWMFMAHCMSPVSVAYQLPGCLWHTACHPFRLLTNCLDVYGTLHVTRFGCLPIAWMFMAHCMSPVSVAYQLPGCLWHTACHPFRLLTNCLDVYGTLHVTRFGCLPIAWMFMAHCMSPVSVAYQLPGCLWHTACHPFRLLTNCLDVYGILHVTRFGCLPIAWMFMAHCMSPVSVAYQLPECLWHTACHPFRLLTNCLDVYGILHVTRFGCLPIAWMFMAYCMSPVSVAYQLPGCLWHTACHPFRLLTNCLDVYGTLHVTRFGCLLISWMFMAHCMSPVSVAYQLPGCLWHTACHPFRLLANCLDFYGTLHVTRFGCLPIAWMFMAHCMSPVSVAYQLPGCLWHTACHPFRLLTNCLDVYGTLHVTRFGCLPIAWMFMAYCMSPVSVAYQLPGCLWHTACHPFRLLTNCLDVYGTLHVTRFGCLPIAWMFMAHCMSPVSVAYQLPGCLWHTACHPFRLLTNCLDVYGTLHVTRFGCLPIAWMFMAYCMSPVSVAYQLPGCLWHTACHPFRLLTNCLDVYGTLHVTRFGCLPIAWMFMAYCMSPVSVAYQLPGCLWHTACHPFRLLTNCLDVYGTLHVTRFGCLPIAWMFMAYCMSPVSVAYQLPGCLWHTACHPFRLLTNCLDVYGTLHVTRFGCLPIAWMFMAHCMSPVSVAYQLPGCLWHTACHPFRLLTNCLDVYGTLHVTRFGCLPIAWMFMAYCMSPVSVAYQLPGCLWHTACHPFRLLTNCLDVYGTLHVTRFGCLPIAWMFMAHCMSPVSVAYQLPGCLWHTACHPFRLLTNCLDVYGTLHVTRFGCLPIAWMFMAHCMSPVSVAYQLPGCLWHTACHPFRLLTNCLDVYGILHVTRFGCLPIAWMFMAYCMSPVSVAYQLPGCLWHTACHPFRLLTNCLDVYGILHVTRFGCLPIAWMFMAHCMSPVSVAYQLPGCLWHTACHPFRLLTNCLDVYGILHVTRFGCLPIAWMFMAHCMSPVSVAYQLPGCLWHTACHPFRLLTNCLDVYGILHVTRFGCLPIAWMFMAYCMSPVSVACQLPGCLWHTACHPFRLLTNCLDVYGTLHVTRFGCLPIAWMFMAHCMSPVSVAYQLPGCLWHTACHPFRLLTNCLDVYGILHVTRFGCLPIAWMFMAHYMSPVSVAYQLPGCLWHTACHPFRLLTNCLDVYGILHVTRFGCLPIAWMFMAYCMSPVSVAYQLPGCLWHTACHPGGSMAG